MKRTDIALMILMAMPLGAQAGTGCELVVPQFAFGAYQLLDIAPTDASALLEVRCMVDGQTAATVSYTIAIGPSPGGSLAPRSMIGPGDTLRYNLYANGSRTLVWGDGSQGSVTVSGSLNLPGQSSVSHPIFGRIPPGQLVTAGQYGDQLMIQLSF